MTDPVQIAAIAKGLTDKQRAALDAVCKTNGGGVRLRCSVAGGGYGVPIDRVYRKLYSLDLIQGKSGEYETVVHTRFGLAVRSYLETNNG